jgi:hypothetical protein
MSKNKYQVVHIFHPIRLKIYFEMPTALCSEDRGCAPGFC